MIGGSPKSSALTSQIRSNSGGTMFPRIPSASPPPFKNEVKLPQNSIKTALKEAMRQQRKRAEQEQREKKNRVNLLKNEIKNELKTMIQNRLTVSNIEYTEVAEEGYENPMGDLTSEALNENIIPRVTNLKEKKRM